ncbi:hypothetical protein NDU88_001100 [Pleurodeles waltl]|uniref:Uncharacterized protein n=1 Tax=Pleurodeles waltl TaxID=8319 RepID=A0AAV7S6H6_PLEWA|nr:hypothetical protein NDU88_001100 [Pleurodeles waltl]
MERRRARWSPSECWGTEGGPMVKRGSRIWSAKAPVRVAETRTGRSGTRVGPKHDNRLGPAGSGKQAPGEKLRAEVAQNGIKEDHRRHKR